MDTRLETAQLPFDKSHAFIIGINDYRHLPKLKTAKNDAKKLAQILAAEQGFNVHPPLIDATYDDIEQLKKVMIAEVGKDDRILFYFAGHGIALDGEDSPEGLLAPADARADGSIDSLNEKNSFISMRKLNDFLNRLPCKHMLLILDCCFSGAFRWSNRRRDLQLVLPKCIFKERFALYVRDSAWQALTSSAHDQTAFDISTEKSLGKRDNEYMDHSPFAEALFKGLKGAADVVPADGGDGLITASELYVYLRRQVEHESVKDDNEDRQTPILFPLQKHDKGEFIFLNPRHPLNLPPMPRRNPYKGSRPFETGDEELFYGRENAIRELIRKMKKSNLLVVVGASGSGKTSLVKAGLAPQLRRRGWTIPMMDRPGEKPLAALEKALRQAGAMDEEASFHEDVDLISEGLVSGGNTLVIDQFEELITRDPGEEERSRFIEFLRKLLDACGETSRFRIILTTRADFEPEFRNSALQEYWSRAICKIARPTVGEMREIIEKPIIQEVLIMEPPELIDTIIEDVSWGPGALPLLSITMNNLYRTYIESGRANRVLHEEDYKKFDGINGLICSKAGNIRDSLDTPHRDAMREIILRMTSMEGNEFVARKLWMKELDYSENENSRVKATIDNLLEARLIVLDRDDEKQACVEPSHEALIREWNDFREEMGRGAGEFISLRNRLREAVEDHTTGEGKLWYDNKNLKPLKKQLYSKDSGLNKRETIFIEKSLKAKKRKTIRLTSAIMIAILLMVGLSFFLVDRARVAKANYLTSRAQLKLEDNPIRAMRLAEKAYRFNNGPDVLRVLSAAAASALKRPFYSVTMRHERPVNGAVFSPSGARMLTLSSDGAAKLWNPEGNLLKTFPHDDVVYSAEFSPDGSSVLTVSRGNAAKLWNLEGALLHEFTHEKQVSTAVFSPDGRRILTASEDDTARLWSSRGELLDVFTHVRDINTALFSGDGGRILTIFNDRSAVLFDLNGWDVVSFKGVVSAEFSPGGERILFVSSDNKVKLCGPDGAVLKNFVISDEVVSSARFSPDGSSILTSYLDGKVRLWEQDARILAVFDSHGDNITSATFSPDGERILTASSDKTAKLWDLDGNLIAELDKHDDAVVSAVFSPDGTKILTASRDNTARLWELRDQPAMDINFPKMAVAAATFSPDGRRVLVSSGEKALKVWDSRDYRATIITEKANINHAVFSPGGDRILTTASDKTARLWNINGNLMQEFNRHAANVNSAVFSRDGDRILTASFDHTAKLWDPKGVLLADLNKHVHGVNTAVFSPDGRTILTASYDKTARLWDLTGNLMASFNRQMHNVTTAIFSPDGEKVLTISVVARLYDLNGRSLAEFDKHKGGVTFAAFSPDGSKLLTAGNDRTAKLWDLKGRLLSDFIGHEGIVYTAMFSPDGKRVVTASADGTVKSWDLDGAILSDFTGHEGVVYSAEFSPDGARILSASSDRTVALRFTPETILEWLKTAKIPLLPSEKGVLAENIDRLLLYQYKARKRIWKELGIRNTD